MVGFWEGIILRSDLAEGMASIVLSGSVEQGRQLELQSCWKDSFFGYRSSPHHFFG